MSLKVNFIILFAVLAINTVAQKNALNSITENDLKAHLEFISSDNMKGRSFGTEIPGLDITADYLQSQCKKMGLKPGFNDLFQRFEMISVKSDTVNSFMQVYDKNNKLLFESRDFVDFKMDTTDKVLEGNLVFAGYGWKDEKSGYNDLKEVDIKDKLVLYMMGNREMAVDTSGKGLGVNIEDMKSVNLLKMGAKGLISVVDPKFKDSVSVKMLRAYQAIGFSQLKNDSIIPQRIPVPFDALISNSLADQILTSHGKSLQQLQEAIIKAGEPKSFELDQVRIRCKFSKIVKLEAGKNVVGYLEGSDPVLRNECVILTAHYDHLGADSNGDIYNGADDNGSGTVALLEIAEAFTKMENPPKRSIVFAWVTAEEQGLLGSKYYTRNPLFPLEKTVANINLDMIGRVAGNDSIVKWSIPNSVVDKEGVYVISGKQSSELIKISDKISKKLNLVPSDSLSKILLERSDYYNFYKNGVPILGLTTGLHEDLHRPSDKIDKIDFNKMKRVTEYAFLIANEVANKKKRIVVDNPVSHAK